jgi:hypothetical protein
MGKRKREQDFLSEYNEFISHQYTRSRNGPMSDFALRMWSTRKPYSWKLGLGYLIFGLLALLLLVISIKFGHWDYRIIPLLFFVIISIIMIIWGIIKVLKG